MGNGKQAGRVVNTDLAQDIVTNNEVNGKQASETTIYKRAVRQEVPRMENKIEQFISDTRKVVEKNLSGKNSTSSEEMMDTSDEGGNVTLLHTEYIVDNEAGPSKDHRFSSQPKQAKTPLTAEEEADQMVRDAERSKARLLEVPSEYDHLASLQLNISMMDQDYQMLDSHVEDQLKKKILCFKYVDLSKLLMRNKGSGVRETEQRLEIINRNGMMYFSPVSDRDAVNISSYNKWEKAFRVYSNILTTKYPEKAPELLQYGHIIQTASVSYVWDNVYAYNREFRHHIS